MIKINWDKIIPTNRTFKAAGFFAVVSLIVYVFMDIVGLLSQIESLPLLEKMIFIAVITIYLRDLISFRIKGV